MMMTMGMTLMTLMSLCELDRYLCDYKQKMCTCIERRVLLYIFEHRSLVQDSAAKLWETYYENERKCVYSQTERIQSQLQSVSDILSIMCNTKSRSKRLWPGIGISHFVGV